MIEANYNKVLNDVFDVVQPNVTPVAFSVFMAVWRKTVGFNKKSDRISLTQLEKATGTTRPTVIKAMAELVTKELILEVTNKRGNTYSIQLN
ncbi:MAG: MarR family transcriptional regulator, partial [Moraxellaceae bacterium]